MARHRILIVAAALVVLAVLRWTAPRRSAVSASPEDSASRAVEPDVLHFESIAGAPVERTEPEAVPSESASASEPAAVLPEWPAPSFEYALALSVTGPDDLAVGDLRILAASAGHTLNDVGSTGADGSITVRWLGFEPTMELDLGLGDAAQLRRVTVSAGGEQRLALRDAEQRSRGTMVIRGGASSDRSSEVVEVSLGRLEDASVKSRIVFEDDWTDSDAPEALRDAEGRVRFVEPALGIAAVVPPAEESVVVRSGLRLRSLSLSVTASTRARLLESLAAQQSGVSIAGRVADAQDRPLASVPVHALRLDSRTRTDAFTSAEGVFTFPSVASAEFELVAGGGDFPLARRRVTTGAGATFCDFVLDRGLELVGRLVDRDGAPLALWNVQAADLSESFVDSTTTDAEGRFAIPQVPARPLCILASPGSFADAPPLLACSALRATGDEIVLALDREAVEAGASANFSADPDGESPAASFVRAWRLDTERAAEGVAFQTAFSISSHPGQTHSGPTSLAFDGLPAGWYRFEVLFDGRGIARLDSVQLAPGDELDLGALPLPPSGRLRFEGEHAGRVELELVHRADDVELRCSLALDAPGEVRLPAGDYEAVWRGPRGSQARHVRIDAGSLVRVEP